VVKKIKTQKLHGCGAHTVHTTLRKQPLHTAVWIEQPNLSSVGDQGPCTQTCEGGCRLAEALVVPELVHAHLQY